MSDIDHMTATQAAAHAIAESATNDIWLREAALEQAVKFANREQLANVTLDPAAEVVAIAAKFFGFLKGE